jgi:hypothetical protein
MPMGCSADALHKVSGNLANELDLATAQITIPTLPSRHKQKAASASSEHHFIAAYPRSAPVTGLVVAVGRRQRGGAVDEPARAHMLSGGRLRRRLGPAGGANRTGTSPASTDEHPLDGALREPPLRLRGLSGSWCRPKRRRVPPFPQMKRAAVRNRMTCAGLARTSAGRLCEVPDELSPVATAPHGVAHGPRNQ